MLGSALQRARQDFADRNPNSRRHYDDARRFLPGGHTRTVLTHAPFPLTFVAGRGATLTDADGHEYIDFLGDYTAGLLGHSERRVIDAVTAALGNNASVGGIHPAEARLARLMCERFDLDRVRFTNSGTEANLMAITTAIAATGRNRIIAFVGGYHGGVLYFASGAAPWNAPYDFVLAPYNDPTRSEAVIDANASTMAAVIMEPMLGSGGCVPASPDFARSVAKAAKKAGAVLIADEVMTSRHGTRGMMDLLGVRADITTFGKYIGGGFSFGAFGGSAELLDVFDTSPESARTNVVSHAGTFNNNIASMTAGCTVLGEVFTADVASSHTARGDEFRSQVAEVLARHRAPLSVSGFGSMMSLHGIRPTPTVPGDVAGRDNELNEIVYLGLLQRGVYTAARGMVNLGLAHTDDHMVALLDRLDDLLDELDPHWS
ncbi:MAG: aspartate aminotransferase family protein [Acidimicrobiales bacterium mtb01]|nr:aminotransferase class III-fold pyridoxal phosphate-dependent enzyme [Actinomycetota bacterium]TEX45893.1 MAG: aspartate aminotransferase family protein [Acidimicrobiales bacterium mtb01]